MFLNRLFFHKTLLLSMLMNSLSASSARATMGQQLQFLARRRMRAARERSRPGSPSLPRRHGHLQGVPKKGWARQLSFAHARARALDGEGAALEDYVGASPPTPPAGSALPAPFLSGAGSATRRPPPPGSRPSCWCSARRAGAHPGAPCCIAALPARPHRP